MSEPGVQRKPLAVPAGVSPGRQSGFTLRLSCAVALAGDTSVVVSHEATTNAAAAAIKVIKADRLVMTGPCYPEPRTDNE